MSRPTGGFGLRRSPDFSIAIGPRRGSVDDRASPSSARTDIVGLTLPSSIVDIAGPPELVRATYQGVDVVVDGEVLGIAGSKLAEALDVDDVGRVVAEFRGWFSLVVVDVPRDRILVVTDRLGSRHLLVGQHAGRWVIASTLTPHLEAGGRLDPIGVAWSISNGIVHGGRTLIDGVKVVPPATVFDVRTGKAESYWDLRIEPQVGNERTLRTRLEEALVAAVERDASVPPPDGRGALSLHVSLSGGYDATAILGMLAFRLKRSDVDCFSYAHGGVAERGDAQVAGRLAGRTGYRHQVVESYLGNLPAVVEANATLGQGLMDFVYEVDAWEELAPRFAATDGPVVLTGDEWLGRNAVALRTVEDALESEGIHSFDCVRYLDDLLPAGLYRDLVDGVQSDRERIVSEVSWASNLHDLKDVLYFRNRLPNLVLEWRRRYAARYATIRAPLLDPEVTAVMACAPTRLRRGKRLYRNLVTEQFPQLFGIRRALTRGYLFDLTHEVRRHEVALRTLVGTPSLLDDVISPDVVSHLIDDVVGVAGPSSARQRIRRGVKQIVPPPVVEAVRRRQAPRRSPESRAMVLMRLLVVRRVLRPPG